MPPTDPRRPFPDGAHEDLAVWVEEALQRTTVLEAQVRDLTARVTALELPKITP